MRKKIRVILIVMVMIVTITIIIYRDNRIDNIFDELYYADARKEGSIIYLYMDDGSYKHRGQYSKDGVNTHGLKYIDWITSTTSTGKEYTIENAVYLDAKMSLKVMINNGCNLTAEYEYFYDVRKKELHPNVYIYGLLREGYEAKKEEAERLVEEAKNIIDQFLHGLIVRNEEKTRYNADNWGKYETFPEQRMEYQSNVKEE